MRTPMEPTMSEHKTNKQPLKKLVVAISSRALFNLDAGHQIFKQQGLQAYQNYQLQNENQPLEPGPAFKLVEKFLQLNQNRSKEEPLVEVILLSRNTAETGLRIFHAIEHYNLNITRAVFSGGVSPYIYASSFQADLFLSLNADDVKKAIQSGLAAAHIYQQPTKAHQMPELRIAFDGDAVLFSDESFVIAATRISQCSLIAAKSYLESWGGQGG